MNLFALRSTDPAGLLAVDDPVGPDNDAYILKVARKAKTVVCAWGSPSPLVLERSKHVVAMLRSAGVKLHYLRMSKCGRYPCHPLYLPYSEVPKEWE